MAPPPPPKNARPARSRTPAIAIDENDPFHLKKLSVPRDIMMEELSLLANKGSQLFKLRRKRADKYTYESEGTGRHYNYDNEGNPYIVYGSGGGPGGSGGAGGPGGHHVLIYGQNGVGGQHGGQHGGVGGHGGGGGYGGAGSHGGAGGHDGTGGHGGHGQGHGGHGQGHGSGAGGGDVNGPHSDSGPLQDKLNSLHKAYRSPWEQAIANDPDLLASLVQHLGPPGPKQPFVDYRSFNRKALPYGGFDLANRLSSFVLPKLTFEPVTPETHPAPDGGLQRPNFNRSPQGWASVFPLDEAAPLLVLTAREREERERDDPDEDL